MLTVQGYRIPKKDGNQFKKELTVKPYIPSVFVNPQYVSKYPVYIEDSDYMYLPKHYGIEKFGAPILLKDIVQTDETLWVFKGTIRESQKDAIRAVLPNFEAGETAKILQRDGIVSLQTGGGKTVCALFIMSILRVPTLVIVHNTFLKDQWIERIKQFLPNARIGTVQGDTVDIQDITICMLQSLSMKMYPLNTFESIGFVVVDECHHIASESFSQAIPKITSKYMLGLSATPERKDKLMRVINWFLGPLLYESNTEDKVDALVSVEVFEFPGDSAYNEIIYNSSGVMFTSLMVNKVVANEKRNEFIIQILEDIEDTRQILVLSDRVGHTQTLFDLLPAPLQEKACVLGRAVKADQRAKWCSEKKILIATYSMCKEGFDVSTLNTLVIATPRPDVDQIVGRILRTEKTSRQIHPLIIDIVDVAFRRQYQSRHTLYKSRNYKVQKMKLLENEL